ncbi:prephenate dehydrogenase/arogenate dehydrogenase family protein [bacterium]|nr:prephenate dehydrogenase/arogenate dehydrogenase family protein [bacterium]
MKIGVVGLGLIGGSIFKAINNLHEVIGISVSQKGKESNITDDVTVLKDCDIVFVATHMNKTISVLEELNNILDEDTVVADVCSLKEFLSKKEYKFNFIPTHPMAGTEKTGFENSFKELFEGAKWVICKKQCPENLKKVIEQMGAKIIFATPKEHDEAVALISHMPMVLSQALFKSVQSNALALKLASSGFRDMTRLALSNVEMADDMINLNNKNIQEAILRLYASVGDLIKNDYRYEICDIREQRSKMYDQNGKNVIN